MSQFGKWTACSLWEWPCSVGDCPVCCENAPVRWRIAPFAVRTPFSLWERPSLVGDGHVFCENAPVWWTIALFAVKTTQFGIPNCTRVVLTANGAIVHRTGAFSQQTGRSPTDWVILTTNRGSLAELGRFYYEQGNRSPNRGVLLTHSERGIHLLNWGILTANAAITFRTGTFAQRTWHSLTDLGYRISILATYRISNLAKKAIWRWGAYTLPYPSLVFT